MSGARVVLVTGANRGIGLEVCRQLASRGHRVILTARDRSQADASVQALQPAGDVVPAVLDVTDPRSIQGLADDLAGRGERIDVLVNNAAILVDEGEPLLDLTAEDLRHTFETNIFGPIAVSQAFVPAMVARGYGRIVNVSSEAGQLASMTSYAPAYSMSKAVPAREAHKKVVWPPAAELPVAPSRCDIQSAAVELTEAHMKRREFFERAGLGSAALVTLPGFSPNRTTRPANATTTT